MVALLATGCNGAAGLDDLVFVDGPEPVGGGGVGGGDQPALQCPGGDPDSGDSDGDGLCDDVDPCVGSDNGLDADGDGFCDSEDRCPGDDMVADLDGDGLCDALDDPCLGASNVDGDGDQVCDENDLCFGEVDNPDGTCTVVLHASAAAEHGATLADVNGGGLCQGGGGNVLEGVGQPTWQIERSQSGYGNGLQRDAYLTFDTRVAGVVVAAELRVVHRGHAGNDTIELRAPETFPGWTAIGDAAYTNTHVLVASTSMSQAETDGEARFVVPKSAVDGNGHSQFRLSLTDCPVVYYPDAPNSWTMAAPASSTPPTLTVTYTPAAE